MTNGDLIAVSCKAIGQLFVENIVCFIYIKGHGDIARTKLCMFYNNTLINDAMVSQLSKIILK